MKPDGLWCECGKALPYDHGGCYQQYGKINTKADRHPGDTHKHTHPINGFASLVSGVNPGLGGKFAD